MCARTHAYKYKHVQTHVHTNTNKHTCIHAYMQTYKHAHMHANPHCIKSNMYTNKMGGTRKKIAQTCKHYFSRHKDQQYNSRFYHSENQPWEQLRLVTEKKIASLITKSQPFSLPIRQKNCTQYIQSNFDSN